MTRCERKRRWRWRQELRCTTLGALTFLAGIAARAEPKAVTGLVLSCPRGMALIPDGLLLVQPHQGLISARTSEELEIPDKRKRIEAFCLDQREVMGAQARRKKAHRIPLEVPFARAKEHCRRLGRRLPTLDEWRFAAMGTMNRRFPWGNDVRAPVERCLKGESPTSSEPCSDETTDGVAGLFFRPIEWVQPRSEKMFTSAGFWSLASEKPSLRSITSNSSSTGLGFRCASEPVRKTSPIEPTEVPEVVWNQSVAKLLEQDVARQRSEMPHFVGAIPDGPGLRSTVLDRFYAMGTASRDEYLKARVPFGFALVRPNRQYFGGWDGSGNVLLGNVVYSPRKHAGQWHWDPLAGVVQEDWPDIDREANRGIQHLADGFELLSNGEVRDSAGKSWWNVPVGAGLAVAPGGRAVIFVGTLGDKESQLIELDVKSGYKRLLGTAPAGAARIFAPKAGSWFAIDAVDWVHEPEPAHVVQLHAYPTGELVTTTRQCDGVLGLYQDRGLLCGGAPGIFDVETSVYHPGNLKPESGVDHASCRDDHCVFWGVDGPVYRGRVSYPRMALAQFDDPRPIRRHRATLSPDKKWLVSEGYLGISLWDAETGKLTFSNRWSQKQRALDNSHNRLAIAAGQHLFVFNLLDGNVQHIVGPPEPPLRLLWSGSELLWIAKQHNFRLGPTRHPPTKRKPPWDHIASAHGSWLVLSDRSIRGENGDVVQVTNCQDPVLSPDGRFQLCTAIVSGTHAAEIRRFPPCGEPVVRFFLGATQERDDVFWSRDGNWLVIRIRQAVDRTVSRFQWLALDLRDQSVRLLSPDAAALLAHSEDFSPDHGRVLVRSKRRRTTQWSLCELDTQSCRDTPEDSQFVRNDQMLLVESQRFLRLDGSAVGLLSSMSDQAMRFLPAMGTRGFSSRGMEIFGDPNSELLCAVDDRVFPWSVCRADFELPGIFQESLISSR